MYVSVGEEGCVFGCAERERKFCGACVARARRPSERVLPDVVRRRRSAPASFRRREVCCLRPSEDFSICIIGGNFFRVLLLFLFGDDFLRGRACEARFKAFLCE